MGPNPVRCVYMDRADAQVALHISKSALHAAQALVGLDHCLRPDGASVKTGPHDINSIQSGLCLDPLRVTRSVHSVIANHNVEMFLYLALVGHPPQGFGRPFSVRLSVLCLTKICQDAWKIFSRPIFLSGHILQFSFCYEELGSGVTRMFPNQI